MGVFAARPFRIQATDVAMDEGAKQKKMALAWWWASLRRALFRSPSWWQSKNFGRRGQKKIDNRTDRGGSYHTLHSPSTEQNRAEGTEEKRTDFVHLKVQTHEAAFKYTQGRIAGALHASNLEMA